MRLTSGECAGHARASAASEPAERSERRSGERATLSGSPRGEAPRLRTSLLLAIAVFVAGARAALPSGAPPPLGLDLYRPVPDGSWPDPASVRLGRLLFFDTRLSGDERRSCATCHDPRRAFASPLNVVVNGSARSVPALINRVYGASHAWDGAAATIEQQVLRPFGNATELALPADEAIRRVGPHYRHLFQAAVNRQPDVAGMVRALAAYVRTILSGDSRVDRFLAGQRAALTPSERDGLRVFQTRGNCAVCHTRGNFTDEHFHNTGVAWDGRRWNDPGRFLVSRKDRDRGAFKTPTLRDVAETAPYMHDGTLRTLPDVVEFYDRGGRPNPALDPEIRPLRLTAADKQALVAFLRALTGEIREGRSYNP